MTDGTVKPAFKVGCRVRGEIRIYYVEDVADWQTAIAAVRVQIPHATAIVAILPGARGATVKELA